MCTARCPKASEIIETTNVFRLTPSCLARATNRLCKDLGTRCTHLPLCASEVFFSNLYKATIGVDFSVKKFCFDQNTSIIVQLWNLNGHERFSEGMIPIYYQEVKGFILSFNVTNLNTLKIGVPAWVDTIKSNAILPNGEQVPFLLIGNKCDLLTSQERKRVRELAENYAKELGAVGYIECSAKTGGKCRPCLCNYY